MANNRGTYDPEHFLHYPEKNPFSDESQKRLDDLVNDFLRTGLAFVNGASVDDLILQKQRSTGPNLQGLNGFAELEEEPSPEVGELEDAGDGEDAQEDEPFRVDKGKGRDEREGPGLQGLWAQRAAHVTSASSQQGINADDAISLSSGSDSGRVVLDNAEPEDGEGFYEEDPYGDGYLEGHEDDAYQRDGSESGTDLGLVNGRRPSPEQEIIYIGDSDEDEPESRALSDVEFEREFDPQAVPVYGDSREDDSEHASGSEFDEVEDQGDAWRHENNQRDGGDGEGHEWQRHSQGKESDEDEGPADRRWEVDHGRDSPQMREDINPTARHFFPPSPLIDPWTSSGFREASKPSSYVSTAWERQSPWSKRQENEQTGEEEYTDREVDVPPYGFNLSATVPPEPHSDRGNALQSLGLEQRVAENDITLLSAIPANGIADHHLHRLEAPTSEPNMAMSIPVPEHTVSRQLEEESVQGDVARPTKGDEVDEHLRLLPSTDLPRHSIPAPDLIGPEQEFSSLFPETNASALPELPSSIVYPTLPLPSTDSSSMLDFLDIMPPMELSSAGTAHLHEAGERQASAGSSYSFRAVETAISEATSQNDILFVDSTTFTDRENGNSALAGGDPGMAPGGGIVDDLSRHSPIIPNGPHVYSDRYEEDENNGGEDEFVSLSLPESKDETSLAINSRGEDKNDTAILQPAVFGDHLVGTTSPLTTDIVVRSSGHSDAVREPPVEIEMPRPDGDEMEQFAEQDLVVEAAPEQDIRVEIDVLPGYAVQEINLQHHADSIASLEAGVSAPDKVEVSETRAPLGAVPSVSVGSSTPPLSPAATVTNCSSAPDQSVATSDFSTVNQATISVVTSTSSPPPIHISRTSPTSTDIRQPHGSRVGFAIEDDQEDSDILPDPRLPPEPTHLRIPVGVVSTGLADDKEELAESVKVEPPTPHPRSEPEDGSIPDGSEMPLEERPLYGPEMHMVTGEDPEGVDSSANLEQVKQDREGVTDSTDHMANETPGDQDANGEYTTKLPELTYPDSDSEHLSKGDRASVSLPDPPDAYNTGEPSSPPSPTYDIKPQASSFDRGPVTNTDLQTLNHNDDPFVDTNGHAELVHNGDANGGINDNQFEEFPNSTDRDVPPVTPTISDRTKQSPRSSTRGRGKGKGKAAASVDTKNDAYPPRSTIRVQGRGNATGKRSRESDTSLEPSKQRRIARSASAKSLSIGDVTSPSAISDDKSDISSTASSSSAVSRILHPKPSSFVTIPSRSPSIVSQSSPTGSMAPPIRPYVPHNHSHHHMPAPPVAAPRTSPVLPSRQSISPAPSPSQPSTSTHLTRASCTDHKISIPTAHGRMLYFLIPRCSLLEPEVEKDESIVDCGVATREEVKRAVGDLEAIGLDSNILGVIRQLAGVQLMREGQVGYLPMPNEHIRRRGKPMRSHLPPLSLTQEATSHAKAARTSEAKSPLSPSLDGGLISPTLPGPSITRASKAGGTGAHRRKHSKASNADEGAYEPSSEVEEEDEVEEDEVAIAYDEENIVPPPSPSSPKSVRAPKPSKHRKRGLRTDDAAYKPDNNDVVSSSEPESPEIKKKGKGTRKRRPSVSTQGENASVSTVEVGTPSKKKRKRKEAELPTEYEKSPEEPSTKERRRKKPRRKTNGSHKSDIFSSPA